MKRVSLIILMCSLPMILLSVGCRRSHLLDSDSNRNAPPMPADIILNFNPTITDLQPVSPLSRVMNGEQDGAFFVEYPFTQYSKAAGDGRLEGEDVVRNINIYLFYIEPRTQSDPLADPNNPRYNPRYDTIVRHYYRTMKLITAAPNTSYDTIHLNDLYFGDYDAYIFANNGKCTRCGSTKNHNHNLNTKNEAEETIDPWTQADMLTIFSADKLPGNVSNFTSPYNIIGGVLMSSQEKWRIVANGEQGVETTPINLKRLMSKLEFSCINNRFDELGPNRVEIQNIKINNVIERLKPFDNNYVESATQHISPAYVIARNLSNAEVNGPYIAYVIPNHSRPPEHSIVGGTVMDRTFQNAPKLASSVSFGGILKENWESTPMIEFRVYPTDEVGTLDSYNFSPGHYYSFDTNINVINPDDGRLSYFSFEIDGNLHQFGQTPQMSEPIGTWLQTDAFLSLTNYESSTISLHCTAGHDINHSYYTGEFEVDVYEETGEGGYNILETLKPTDNNKWIFNRKVNTNHPEVRKFKFTIRYMQGTKTENQDVVIIAAYLAVGNLLTETESIFNGAFYSY